MKLYSIVLGAVIAAASIPAWGAKGDFDYGWCEVKGPDGNYLMSALMQAPKGPNDDIEREFAAGVGSQQSPNCWFYYANPSEAKSYLDKRKYVIESDEKLGYSLTGWTGSHAITGEPEQAPSGAYLTVKKVGPTPAEAAAESAARELEGQRAAAAANAKRIAGTARLKAETEAQMAKFFEELKKRGNKQ